jgi:hypothetical protein
VLIYLRTAVAFNRSLGIGVGPAAAHGNVLQPRMSVAPENASAPPT